MHRLSSSKLSYLFPLPLILLLLSIFSHPSFRRAPERTRRNLIYWKPHKTGSTSTKFFLEALAASANLTTHFSSPSALYRFQPPTSLFAATVNLSCGVHAAHIHTLPYSARPHEADAGVVLSTTRNVRGFLASRFFHVVKSADKGEFGARDERSSMLWWNFWMTYDACESLRYYDGVPGCDVREGALKRRAQRIADRVDCVIDVDDAQPDADAICRMVGVERCPAFEVRNTGGGHKGYEELLAMDHVVMALRLVERPAMQLRQALMTRRCRLLGKRRTLGRMKEPMWPTVGCTAEGRSL